MNRVQRAGLATMVIVVFTLLGMYQDTQVQAIATFLFCFGLGLFLF